jgi:ABC-type transport system involved in cytochrome c biogenesis ATPase subunit
MAPVVLAQHVTKWYGPRRAVADVSFAIELGEIVALLGPNGSGKSTIFRILIGYLAPSSGRVEVAGHDVVTDSVAVRQAISYVPEDAPLYDHMHVAEFLHFMARIKGLRGAAKKKAVEVAAERLDFSRVMSLPTGKLCRRFQRVSVASALFRSAVVRAGAGRYRPVRFRGSLAIRRSPRCLAQRLSAAFDHRQFRLAVAKALSTRSSPTCRSRCISSRSRSARSNCQNLFSPQPF